MAIPQKPQKSLLFIGILTSDAALFETVKNELNIYGETAHESKTINWNFSNYYNNELGNSIKKRFLFFKKLINPEKIADIKLETNKIEDKYKRKINLDPGYITKTKVLLASAKDRAHKVYIKKGIYGDVVLIFKDKTFTPFPYTFKDFKTEEYINLFNEIRKLI